MMQELESLREQVKRLQERSTLPKKQVDNASPTDQQSN
jgi:hypothetical protein